MIETNKEISLELKHHLYEASVQAHENDIDFMDEQFRQEFGRDAITLREDFGGTGALACDWVKKSPNHLACAIDLDPEPMVYGVENHFARLSDEEQDRMKYIEGNVLDHYEFDTDIICAFNFSYFIFKKRAQLVEYFQKVYDSLGDEGAFFIDLFGGTDARKEMVEETEHDDHTYFWDCEKYNPITHEVLYKIHFETHDDRKKYENVFVYDWRLWGLAEIRDCMEEVGFKTLPFWEGDDGEGGGDGEFYIADDAENCESWVTYIMAVKR